MISARNISSVPPSGRTERKDATIFSIPIGRLGLFSRLIMGVASGVAVFFITFFFAIIGVSIYDKTNGISLLNLNIAYLYIAAPVGLVAMLAFLAYLFQDWARGKLSGAE